jgi:hypothetical protein
MPNRSSAKKTNGRPLHEARGNPRLSEERHDPYRDNAKLRAPRRCKQCNATYLKGRWRWEALTPPAPATTLCPACRRSNDRYPAGEVLLRGDFVTAHADEILRLVRNVEAAETQQHPLHRIMDIRREDGDIVITTTDVHLPRRLGHALEGAWHGELTTHYDEAGYFARVTWRRH